MRTFRTRAFSALAVAGVAIAALGPASGQDRPESILPPGFGEPVAPPPAAQRTPTPGRTPGATRVPAPAASQPSGAAGAPTAVPTPLPDTPTPTPTATATPEPIDPAVLARYEMPPSARRSLDRVGAAGEGEGAFGADAFGAADGGYLETLMRRLSVPLPSRWMSIVLRRTLVARLDTPTGLNGADFAAERAWLLLRMGESVDARAVVESVDDADYTPKLYQVAMNAMLSVGDPGGLCPLADAAAAAVPSRGWTLAQAMCAGLAGEPARASALLKVARRRHVASGIDLLLAEKVAGTGTGSRQAVTIEWTGVDALSAWRFGLAAATIVAIPDELLRTVGRQATYWLAQAPAVPLAGRIAAAEAAAEQGVLSNAALVDLYGAVAEDDDAPSASSAAAQDLASAYADRSADRRRAAIRSLWGDAKPVPYARLVLTARAAARVPPLLQASDADRFVASMLSAGLDRSAARWRPAVAKGGDAWAMIALSDPDAPDRLRYSDLSGYSGSGNAALKQRLLFAGLAGLDRLSPGDVERAAQALDVRIGAQNAWTRALDKAAAAGQAGTVVLLCAVGMQTDSWRGVPPEALYRIVSALRSVGLDGEARMIAAEAIARA